ncbi:hypothetical protein J1605_019533 [Eschrichtius robustus]|uniref:IQ domain-containing protein E n=1 Tax=Eschrichtius robustus TaxID=9764 RepID=A0AB34HKL2_ESCRO|nr:hypothetical protein J1605_019533 [Eschrichtius robustus]
MSFTPQKLWLGSSKQGYVPGTPVYREKEDMYDEIIELKKSLHMQKSNVDLMRTKLRRLEEENSRKDRQIEQLLDPSGVVSGLKQRILKLEQRCKEKDHTIEYGATGGPAGVGKLQTDMKTTNLEEMRIAMETYYEEVRALLPRAGGGVGGPPAEKKIGLKRQKKMSSALLSLSRSVQELTEENQSLKEDLDRVLSSSPTASKIKGLPGVGPPAVGASLWRGRHVGPCSRREVRAEGARRDGCTKGAPSHPAVPPGSVEWSKPRLLRRIAELEKKISLMESPKSHASEVVGSTPPAHSASSPTVHRQPRPDRQEESERLRGFVKRLKGERSALHTQLQERDQEVKQLLQTKADLEKELENMKEGEKEAREREEALREEIQALTRKFQELEESKKGEEENPEEMSPESEKLRLHPNILPPGLIAGFSAPIPDPVILLTLDFLQTRKAPRPPGPSQTDSELDTSEGGSSRPRSGCSEGRRDAAARLLQRRWKGHQHRSLRVTSPRSRPGTADAPVAAWAPAVIRLPVTKKKAVLDEAAVLQEAFRGHLARARVCGPDPPAVPSPPTQDSPEPRVPSPVVQAEGDPWQAEAVTIIQSAFRAHLARARHRKTRVSSEAFLQQHTLVSGAVPAGSAGAWSGLSRLPRLRTLYESPRGKEPAPSDSPEPDRLAAEPSPSGPQPAATPPAEDVNSEDSDEIVVAPPLPTKKIASPP